MIEVFYEERETLTREKVMFLNLVWDFIFTYIIVGHRFLEAKYESL